MKKIIIFTLTNAILISSCNYSGKLTKRYKSIEIIKDDTFIQDNIEVNAYVIEKEKSDPPKSKNIFDLSSKAQAALISEVSKKESTSANFLLTLTNNLSAKNNNPTEIIDYSLFEKRIVISIRNKSHFPADRISKIKITLDIGSEVKMLSCNKLTTEYQTLDLGKLNYSNSQNTELTGNANIESGSEATVTGDNSTGKVTGKAGAGITGKTSANRSFSEEVFLKQRMVVLNATISKNKLSLYQESISGLDLTGNILADVTLGIEDIKVEKIYSFSELLKNEALNEAKNIKVTEKIIIYPNITNDVKATISFESDFRKVFKNDKTISESDDKVKLYYGKATKSDTEIIIPKSKILPKLWKLTFTNDSGKLPLQIKSPTAVGSGDLLFNSIFEARDFVFWLKTKYNDSKNTLTIGSQSYILIMPSTFLTIQNIEIYPYN